MSMTREEVKYVSKDYVNYLLDKQEHHNEKYTEYDIRQAFEMGAKWVEEHKNIWHDATEEPKIGSNIVAINKYGKWCDIKSYGSKYYLGGLKGWKCRVRTFDIQKWAYISDLLPK